ncbi:MAG: hypothetical protein MJ237_06260 [bacterium]|nr:hypothetical protein [bacterium]
MNEENKNPYWYWNGVESVVLPPIPQEGGGEGGLTPEQALELQQIKIKTDKILEDIIGDNPSTDPTLYELVKQNNVLLDEISHKVSLTADDATEDWNNTEPIMND